MYVVKEPKKSNNIKNAGNVHISDEAEIIWPVNLTDVTTTLSTKPASHPIQHSTPD